MNPEGLQESLSAVMDNEAGELELRRVLAGSADPLLRAKWARYQVARAAMRKELLEPRLDLASKVSAALDAEGETTVRHKRSVGILAQLAVAASVTVAVLVGVRFYAGDASEAVQMAELESAPATMQSIQEQAVLAGFSQEAKAVDESSETEGASQWLQANEDIQAENGAE